MPNRRLPAALAAALAAGLSIPAASAHASDTYTLVQSGEIVWDSDGDGVFTNDDDRGGSFTISVSVAEGTPDIFGGDGDTVSVYQASINYALFSFPDPLGSGTLELTPGGPAGLAITASPSDFHTFEVLLETGSGVLRPLISLPAGTLPNADLPTNDLALTPDLVTTSSESTVTINGTPWTTVADTANYYVTNDEHDIFTTLVNYETNRQEIWKLRMAADGDVALTGLHFTPDFPTANFARWITYDPCRGRVVVENNLATTSLVLIDETGTATTLDVPLPPLADIQMATASMHGLIYLSDGARMHYIDAEDQVHPLLDRDGNHVTIPGSPMFYHDESNALYVSQWITYGFGIDENFIHQFKLNGAGNMVIEHSVVEASLVDPNLDAVLTFGDGPDGTVFLHHWANNGNVWPKARLLHPDTLEIETFASAGFNNFDTPSGFVTGSPDLREGIYHPGFDLAILTQDGAYPGLRTYARGTVDTVGAYASIVPANPMLNSADVFYMALRKNNCSCINDVTSDGIFDLDDINQWITWFTSADLQADLSGDGILDLDDITIFILLAVNGCPVVNG